MNEKFWLNDPNVLFNNCKLLPTAEMTNSERLNAATRLLLLVVVAMYFLNYENYLAVLVIGLIVILVLKTSMVEGFSPRRGRHDPCHTCGFDSTLSYINTKYENPTFTSHVNYGLHSYANQKYKVIPQYVPAPYREVWRNEVKDCNEFSQFPKSYEILGNGNGNGNYQFIPQEKCYYKDTAWVDNTPTGNCGFQKQSAMPAIQSNFMTSSLDYRNAIMGDYIDQIERTRNHLCTDIKPGRKTF